jgi:hypothetical protein
VSRCISVISHARFNRHKIRNGVCARCLQPAFVKITAVTTSPSKSFVENLVVFPEQVEIAKEILGIA